MKDGIYKYNLSTFYSLLNGSIGEILNRPITGNDYSEIIVHRVYAHLSMFNDYEDSSNISLLCEYGLSTQEAIDIISALNTTVARVLGTLGGLNPELYSWDAGITEDTLVIVIDLKS